MPRKQRIMRVAALGLMAASAGIFAVQSGLVPGLPSAAAPAPVAAAPSFAAVDSMTASFSSGRLPDGNAAADLPVMPRFGVEQPALPQPGPALPGRMAATPDMPGPAPEAAFSQFGLPCGLTVSATPAPAAMIALDAMDPCRPGARVVIGHAGLTLTEQLDAMGLLAVDLPAFASPAEVTVRLDDVTETVSTVLPDLALFDRVGVAWQDRRDLQLHAMEFGAVYGDPGHIWTDNPGTPDRAEAGIGGFVTRLGSDAVESPEMAEVYTFPRDTLTRQGAVRLSIEAPVTDHNCGLSTVARTLQTEAGAPVTITGLTFTLPGCNAVGEYLVLQNLLQDLRIAAN